MKILSSNAPRRAVRARVTPCISLLLAVSACASDPVGRGSDLGRAGDPADGEGARDASATDRDGAAGGTGSDAAVALGTDAQEVCADVETTPLRAIPSVVFLVDGSSSMRCSYPEHPTCDCDAQVRGTCQADAGTTRWQALSAALFGADQQAGLVAELGSVVRFGLWVYNDNPLEGVCPGFPARVDPALDHASALAAALPAQPPGYNTPTGSALAALVEALPDAAARDQDKLGPQRIVLATDGQPFACVDPDTLEAPALDYASVLTATDAAAAKDIDVYVMSLAPASGDFAAHLDEVARRGATTHAYTPSNADELAAALRAIIEDAISCTVELSGEISDPSHCGGKAFLGGTPLTCGDADGFSIVGPTTVRLEGEACARFKREPGIELAMTFPCELFAPL